MREVGIFKFEGRFVYREHAVKRMFRRGINEYDISTALGKAWIVETYPEDQPFPSMLVLGYANQRPLHIVLGIDEQKHVAYVITVYEPDPENWHDDFLRRRQ